MSEDAELERMFESVSAFADESYSRATFYADALIEIAAAFDNEGFCWHCANHYYVGCREAAYKAGIGHSPDPCPGLAARRALGIA